MPGLVVTTGVRVGAAGTTDAPASSFFIVGTAERGPDSAYALIESMAQAESVYGGELAGTTLYRHLEIFFEEGGTRAYVRRVVGSGSDVADLESLGAPGDLDVVPVGAGTWANSDADGPLSVEIVAGVIAGTVRVVVTYGGGVVHRSGDCTTNRALADSINNNVSNLLVATYDPDAATVTPDGPYTFAGGNDDNDPTDPQMVDGLDSFLPELGAGAVAIPEYFGTDIWDGIKEHALLNNRVAFCGFENLYSGGGETPQDELDTAKAALVAGSGSVSYYGDTQVEQTKAGAVAFFWPHVTVPNATGGTDICSPESFAAAARCRAHVQTGSWRPAAGAISASRFVTGLLYPVTSALSDEANAARINPLRIVDNTVRVYGARSVSGDESNWRYITYRDTLNYIVVVAERRLEPYIFNVIDSRGVIFSDISATLTNMLEPLRAAGGIYEGRDAAGATTDRGYTVEVSDALNPQEQLAAGVIAAKVGVRVSSVGETINLVITKSNLTTGI